jgi:hypothetical protein
VALEFVGECGNSRKGHAQGSQRGTPFRVNGAGRAQEQNVQVGFRARSLDGRHELGVLPFLFCVLIWVCERGVGAVADLNDVDGTS